MTKCQICRSEYTKQRMMQKCCSTECAEIFGKNKTKQEVAKKMRFETKLRKEKLKSNSDFANEAQSAVNRYVNLRDRDIPCICCGKSPYEGVRHASHYKSRGSNSYLRYSLWNLHSACYSCNVMKSGNIGDYRPNLIKKIGIERVEFLENASRSRSYSKEYLVRLKRVFAKKALRAEKRINKG